MNKKPKRSLNHDIVDSPEGAGISKRNKSAQGIKEKARPGEPSTEIKAKSEEKGGAGGGS